MEKQRALKKLGCWFENEVLLEKKDTASITTKKYNENDEYRRILFSPTMKSWVQYESIFPLLTKWYSLAVRIWAYRTHITYGILQINLEII